MHSASGHFTATCSTTWRLACSVRSSSLPGKQTGVGPMLRRGRNRTRRSLYASLLWLEVTSLAAAPPLAQPHGDQIFTYVQAEQLEYRVANDGADTFSWDV